MVEVARAIDGDRRIGRVAAARHGVVTSADARRAGLSGRQVQWRVETGRWRRVARGVFVVAGAPATPHQAVLAACAAGPTGSVASHLSAAFLFGLLPASSSVHVTVGPSQSNTSRLAVVHRARLSRPDRTRVGAIPSTAPARTLVDLASVLDAGRTRELLDKSLVAGRTTRRAVDAALDRATAIQSPRGAAVVRAALEPWRSGITFESVAEVRLFRRFRSWGLPDPVGQHVVVDAAGSFVARVDFAWPERKVAVEYQGEAFHGLGRAAADEARIARLESLGWRVEEAGADDLRPGSARLGAVLRPLLDRRAA